MIAGASLLGGKASAASGDYEAMLVNCIDPRFTTNSLGYMGSNNMRDRYSQFVIAGGPIGAIHTRFASWHSAFWDNLDIGPGRHHGFERQRGSRGLISAFPAISGESHQLNSLRFGGTALRFRQNDSGRS
ncbi:MAG: hypothetical protein EBU14_09060 [Acetobacteraceae bacterium]|nr:hypothetical protein [Acetobacteraceae bacterium]